MKTFLSAMLAAMLATSAIGAEIDCETEAVDPYADYDNPAQSVHVTIAAVPGTFFDCTNGANILRHRPADVQAAVNLACAAKL